MKNSPSWWWIFYFVILRLFSTPIQIPPLPEITFRGWKPGNGTTANEIRPIAEVVNSCFTTKLARKSCNLEFQENSGCRRRDRRGRLTSSAALSVRLSVCMPVVIAIKTAPLTLPVGSVFCQQEVVISEQARERTHIHKASIPTIPIQSIRQDPLICFNFVLTLGTHVKLRFLYILFTPCKSHHYQKSPSGWRPGGTK